MYLVFQFQMSEQYPSAGLQLTWGTCRQHFILKLPLVQRKQVGNTMKMLRILVSKFDFSFWHAYVVFTPSAINFASMCIIVYTLS